LLEHNILYRPCTLPKHNKVMNLVKY